MQKLEALIISVNYSDFLSWSLPANKQLFDRVLVVTSKDDELTQKICDHNYVECLRTDCMYDDGAVFNKGKAINAGLTKLDFSDWVCHLDADVVLPSRARELLVRSKPQENKLYSVDRLMVPSFDSWVAFLSNPILQQIYCRTQLTAFPVGYRLFFDNGWVPAGYFQMFNRKFFDENEKKWYPENSPNAADSDMTFSMKWARENRILIPEFAVYHLDSEGGIDRPTGTNWEGRRTPYFGII